MKRMSIAEQTLKKQIERIENDMRVIAEEQVVLKTRREALLNQRDQLVLEMERLIRARHLASNQRKGAND
jgi:hypothetical protein